MTTPTYRILLVSFVDASPWTGMGRWTYRVAAAAREMGHEVEAWFSGDFPRVRALGPFATLIMPAVLALRLVQRRADFDAVVLHEPLGLWYGLVRRFWKSLPPMIAMSHGVDEEK